jgi:hypothetical protein
VPSASKESCLGVRTQIRSWNGRLGLLVRMVTQEEALAAIENAMRHIPMLTKPSDPPFRSWE